VTGRDLFPVESARDFEGEMVILNADIPREDDSTTTWGGGSRAMNDLCTSDTKAKGRTWGWYGMIPVSAIFSTILSI
jgi:hypothetical protein